jgi:hypothetical protein
MDKISDIVLPLAIAATVVLLGFKVISCAQIELTDCTDSYSDTKPVACLTDKEEKLRERKAELEIKQMEREYGPPNDGDIRQMEMDIDLLKADVEVLAQEQRKLKSGK